MNPSPFSLDGKVAVVTGGYGVLGGSIASGLAAAGARIAILGRRRDSAERKAEAPGPTPAPPPEQPWIKTLTTEPSGR